MSLRRIGCLSGNIIILERANGLNAQQQDVVFRTGLEVLLLSLLLTARFHDDLATGLLFKMVATANIKHLASMPEVVPAASATIPDELRRPITVYNAARARHLPFVDRRHGGCRV